VKFGRTLQVTPEKAAEIKPMRETMTVPEIIKATGLSKASVYRALGA
jgi:predicted DNA-binding transcriptional regulator AlpA